MDSDYLKQTSHKEITVEKLKQSLLSSWKTGSQLPSQTKSRKLKANSTDGTANDSPHGFVPESNLNSPQCKGTTKTNYTQTRLKINTTNNLPFGDLINDDQPDGEQLILFHNINGMKDNKSWYQIIQMMRELDVNIFGFAELNQSITRGYSNTWINTIRKIFYYSCSSFSESRVHLESDYKPGGTMTTITGKWQSRVTEIGQDAKGLSHWSYMQVRSKKAKLMIITAYQPTVGHGPSTVWMQQWALLREAGEKNPDPINIFYDDLASCLHQWKLLGNEMILMMDSNKPIGDKPSKLTGILNKLEMVDLV
jgi:hypothetical protein